MKTRSQALRDLGLVVAESVGRMRTMTAREVAEAAWTPDHKMSVDELTDYADENGLCKPDESRA